VREQREVTGHAVRAMYLYSAMADLAGETGDESLREACRAIWDDVTQRKLYLTGGIGPSRHNEGFTVPYDLPNATAYAETCAAIGLVFWAHRLLQLACDGRYADVLERALYNGVISGVSLDGEKFFYENPLASAGTHHRQSWFGCACCPPNLARILASLGSYIYSQGDESLAVHLYVQGDAEVTLGTTAVHVRQQTDYPWDGTVRLTLTPTAATEFILRLRIPGWCRQATVAINGAEVLPIIEHGYACLRRQWQPGDVVEVSLAMPVEQVAAHPLVVQDSGRVALQRGPVVYCLEGVDHTGSVHSVLLPKDAHLTTRFDPDLLGGVVVIEGEALAVDQEKWGTELYQPADAASVHPTPLRAVPYATWDNRAPGEMAVWLPRG
jgi:DUF1680 family protein